MNKKVASALVGVGLVGASFGVAQTAFAQDGVIATTFGA